MPKCIGKSIYFFDGCIGASQPVMRTSHPGPVILLWGKNVARVRLA
jgi:hypothetical protein